MLDMNSLKKSFGLATAGAVISVLTLVNALAAPLAIKDSPLFLSDNTAPLNMLVMGRDHRIYYEAYNDASDLDGDGVLDTRYKPGTIDYYGYFDSKKCYQYSSNIFTPVSVTANKQCTGQWSGDFLNYLTTSRIDALRKVLYGGLRSTDSATDTIRQRSYIPQDAHSWGKEYTSIAVDGYDITKYTPYNLPNANRRHLFANTTVSADAIDNSSTNPAANGTALPKLRVLQNRNNRIWEWVSKERPVAGSEIDNSAVGGGTGDAVNPSDFVVRVKVCVTGMIEANCKVYGASNKPTGLLQDYGENDAMLFGLLTGSYGKPHDGGVLRKVVSTVKTEINAVTGQYYYNQDPPGIISSIDRLRVTNFNGTNYTCNQIGDSRPDTNGDCSMWGNPTAEMMYEVVRYFAGKGAPTAAFASGAVNSEETSLGLKAAGWDNPYSTQPRCSKPFETVISDVNPSFDSDKVPGSAFTGYSGDIPGMNVTTLGQMIWDGEYGAPGRFFIGESPVGTYDGAPTVKTVTSFANIRGISPEGPTREGSFNAASVAYYGLENDLNTVTGEQKLQTFSVALASPLPQIVIPVGGKKITLVPFAKSVAGGNPGFSPATGAYQATDQIVDFYVDTLTPTYGKFRVNYEDVEQGSDHDMDAIAVYEYTVRANNTVDVTVTSEYAAGGIVQHMGYVISGTSGRDGTYLEVRDKDTGAGSDPDYFLDTPPGQWPPGQNYADGVALPLGPVTRNFSPGSGTAAGFLKDPLWYAAKWGGFEDSDGDAKPNLPSEWDQDNDGDPDNYFLVTNALTLKDQLAKAFNDIINRNASSSAAAVNSGSIGSNTRIYQAKFSSQFWSGQLLAYPISSAGALGAVQWDAATQVPSAGSRKIITVNSSVTGLPNPVNNAGVPFTWSAIDAVRKAQLQPLDTKGSDRLDYLRGDRSKEIPASGGVFRKRASLLGDIVNSAPVFMGPPPFLYRDSMEANPYSAFRTTWINRPGTVYVGANDGMLHAFDGATGAERFAFVPASVYRNLYKLSDPTYAHQYFVDATPTVIDAYYASAWHTVLASGLNKGGQGVFALDVTNPGAVTEGNAASTFLWEFSDKSDLDMGYSYSRPAIVKMKNGQWAAVFGNGYNNTEADGLVSLLGNAVLYIVDIQTGALIKKIDTQTGMLQDPTGALRPNGLATPLLVDRDNDGVVEYAYAGDLFGNMWKFDLTGTTPGSWVVDYGSVLAPLPLFTAKDSLGRPQPITERPVVAFGPNGVGQLVMFGTGKFLEPSDRDISTLKPQSFYGIFDKNTGVAATDRVLARTALVQQTITAERTASLGGVNYGLRDTSTNAVDPALKSGWYIDLISPGGFNGEMQVTDPVFRNGRVVFTTLIPETDVCAFGGKSWLMEMNALTGAMLDKAPLDLDRDGKFDEQTFSGMQLDAIANRAAVLTSQQVPVNGQGGTPEEYKVIADTSGNVRVIRENPGAGALNRQSWRQVR